MSAPTHVYEIFVKASPRRVWQAITDPDYTRRYFHRTAIESTFEPGAGLSLRDARRQRRRRRDDRGGRAPSGGW